MRAGGVAGGGAEGVVALGPVAPGGAWEAFSAAHGGEWSGSKVTFALETGEVQPLPDVLVPEQYRAWDMKIFDLQHQISCGSREEGDGGDGAAVPLARRLRTIAPTAGCEADASTVVDDVRDALDPADVGLVRFEDGSYARGPVSLAEAHLPGPANEGRGAPFVTEIGLLRPGAGGAAPMRARVITSTHINPDGGLWGRTFAVFLERREGPWDPSASLDCACGSPLPPWGEKPADADALAAFPPSAAPCTASLPEGLSLASWNDPAAGYTLEVGWCLDGASRLFLRRTYDLAGALVACTLDRQSAS